MTPPRWMPPAGRRSSRGRRIPGSWRSGRPVSTMTGSSARSPTSLPTSGATSTWRWRRASPRSCTAGRPRDGAMPRMRSSRSCARRALVVRIGAPRSGIGRQPSSTRFPGPLDYARQVIDLGLAISFSGLVFRRGEEASAEAVAAVPAERLLIETDSPFLSPPGAPRSRNQPEWVRVTGEWAAERRGTTIDRLGPDLVAAYDRTFPGLRRTS